MIHTQVANYQIHKTSSGSYQSTTFMSKVENFKVSNPRRSSRLARYVDMEWKISFPSRIPIDPDFVEQPANQPADPTLSAPFSFPQYQEPSADVSAHFEAAGLRIQTPYISTFESRTTTRIRQEARPKQTKQERGGREPKSFASYKTSPTHP